MTVCVCATASSSCTKASSQIGRYRLARAGLSVELLRGSTGGRAWLPSILHATSKDERRRLRLPSRRRLLCSQLRMSGWRAEDKDERRGGLLGVRRSRTRFVRSPVRLTNAGKSTVGSDQPDLSLETLSNDLVHVLAKVFPDRAQAPSLILVGHSMVREYLSCDDARREGRSSPMRAIGFRRTSRLSSA